MTDITERASINPIRQRYFGEHRPASTLVEVNALVDPRMKVETEAVAYVGNRKFAGSAATPWRSWIIAQERHGVARSQQLLHRHSGSRTIVS